MDLSFSGAGFMGCYYFGVVDCWNKYIPRDRVRRVAGASAGSLIAAYYLMDLPLEDCLKEIIEMTEYARSLPLGVFDRSNQVVDVLPRCLDKCFPEDAHKRVNGRLFVSMTRLRDLKSVIVSEFETRQDLIDALNCSCFIPVWSGNHVSTYKGVKYIDGGFSNNLPVFDEHTIRVSCFSGASDIAPYDQARMELLSGKGNLQGMSFDISWKNLRRGARALWPPPASFIANLLELGFSDTKEFILKNDLIQCDRCFRATKRELQPIYAQITPTISPAASPAVSRASSILNLSAIAPAAGNKLRVSSKRRSRHSSSSAGQDELAPIRIKEHRRQSTAGCTFESNRHKSGKQMKRKALERLRSEADLAAAAADDVHAKTSFAAKLRERLQQVASKSAQRDSGATEKEHAGAIAVPNIVVDEPIAQPDEANGKPDLTEVSKRRGEEEEEETPVETKIRSSSLSSSNDSALGLETGSTPRNGLMFSSPAEKFIAGAKPRAQSISTTTDSASNVLSQAGQAGSATTGLFASAPSPLPSCPPSPNLNRHCTECIRLRQRARMDELDESIKKLVEHYSQYPTKEPEREFSSIKWKLACWLRQIGPPKYSYSFQTPDEAAPEPARTSGEQEEEEEVDAADDDDPAEATMAELKAKRKASHPFAWPASEQIQASS